jgi:hypothetical protein
MIYAHTMGKVFQLVLALIITMPVFSQVHQTYRYEKENKYGDEEFSVIGLKEDGLALIRGTKKYKSGQRTWEVTLLDTALQETGTVEFDVGNRSDLIGYEHSPGLAHILFVKNEAVGEMQLVTIEISSRETSRQDLKPELNFRLTHFNKVGGNFIFGGFVNFEPCVLLYNTESENLKLIPGFFQKDTELIDVRVNQNQTFNTIILDRGDREGRKAIFKTFDSSGIQLLEDITPVDNSIILQTGISSTLERDELVVMGTWGKRNSKSALGFYVLPINPFTENNVVPIYFAQLEHYLDYLKPKRANAIKLKTQRALTNNKTPDFTNYVMPYRIIEHANGFVLLAESYSPSSGTYQPSYGYSAYPTTYPYYYPYGSYYPPYRQYAPRPSAYGSNVVTTEELKKTQSIVLNVDATGQTVWDFSMKFSDLRTETLRQTSEVWIGTDSLHVLYKKESELKIKSVNLTTQEYQEVTKSIKLTDSHDEIRGERKHFGALEFWFGNNFYVWGYQSIRNKTKPDRTRDVFYINRIMVD